MCGIAGIYDFTGGKIPRDVLERMAAALAHRGPDQSGIHIDGNIGLVHRRLKIIDLSEAAAQPMHDEQSRFFVLLNGEIYNFLGLRETLRSRYSFFSNSDTEVILRCFQEYGENTWKHLNGMFAIAVYDANSRDLFLARDHAGIKPIYYFQDEEKLIFGSEIKALFATGLIPRDTDDESIALYLQLGYFPADTTAYRRIRKLKPGQVARVRSDAVKITTFWNIRDFLYQPSSSKPADQLSEDLDRLLMNSVRQQMISDVPLGAFLSGGIDSSFIVALMRKISPLPVKTFTVGFSRMGYYDERRYAARLAKYFGTEHYEFVVESGIRDVLPGIVNTFDEPFADSSAIPTFCLAQLARNHVTVALSGTGGDEIFGGYRKYLAAHWAGTYLTLPEPVRSAFRKTIALLPASRKSLWQERTLLLQRFSSLNPASQVDSQINSIFPLGEVCELLGAETTPGVRFVPVDASIAENMMLFDFEFFLPEDLLVKEDRATMAFGLEARVPYLDRALIEFMTSLPLKLKVTAMATKRLFRKVAGSYLPPWILRRPKHGFGSPVAEWLRTDLRDMVRDMLLSPCSFAKSPKIDRRLQEHLSGAADHSRQLWSLLMLELWMRQKQFR